MYKDKVKISIIIPTYNSEKFILECLESVFNQTYPAYEIIIINDGSTDCTDDIIRNCLELQKNIVYLTQDNRGQGASRNRALQIVRGNYVMFIDSDDFIEPVTLEVCAKKAYEDKCDFVNFQWKSYNNKTGKFKYSFLNKSYAQSNILVGLECEKLLTVRAYYTCCNMYRYDFLMTNNIRYGEGYIYEDHIFYTKACLCAQTVSLIHSPLYNYRLHDEATTKKRLGNRHYGGQLQATMETIEILHKLGCSEYAKVAIGNHAYKSFIHIYDNKTPRNQRMIFLKGFVDLISPIIFKYENKLVNDFRKLYRKKMFADKKYFGIAKTLWVMSLKIKIKRRLSTIRKFIKKVMNYKKVYYALQRKKPILKNCILFLGFSGKFIGNSKYLYIQMKKLYPDIKCCFVTDTCEVNISERVRKNSLKYYHYLARAKIIIAETWTPSNIAKRKEQILLQTWHASTLKKLLFDTAEPYTTGKNYSQKIQKYRGIQKWDYFLTDNEFSKKYYRTSFLLKESQIIAYGYPRVKFLLDNEFNDGLKGTIKEKYGIPGDKKIVMYAPTWRDYNYHDNNYDFLLDLEHLSDLLGDEYVILFRDHDFIKKTDEMQGSFINANNFDTQELLLISNFVISDYSSIVFDALAINIPILIYANDRELYENARGVYPEIYKDLSCWDTKNEMDLFKKIQNYKIDEHYYYVKEKYCLGIEDYRLPEFLKNKL